MIYGHAANIANSKWLGRRIFISQFLAIFNLVGRLIGGIISDKIGRFNVMRIIFCHPSSEYFAVLRLSLYRHA
jgi:nitrate/nitrite transporter NarK